MYKGYVIFNCFTERLLITLCYLGEQQTFIFVRSNTPIKAVLNSYLSYVND